MVADRRTSETALCRLNAAVPQWFSRASAPGGKASDKRWSVGGTHKRSFSPRYAPRGWSRRVGGD